MRRSTELTPEAFEALLARLHPDRDRAGAEYEARRARLTFLFQCRRCPEADQLADEVLTRVAQRQQREQIRNLDAFIAEVAKNVLLEQAREPKPVSLDDSPSVQRVVDAKSTEAFASDPADLERRDLMRLSMDGLSAEESSLLNEFHDGRGIERIRRRKALAHRLGISVNALCQRVFRLRRRLLRDVDRATAAARDDRKKWKR